MARRRVPALLAGAVLGIAAAGATAQAAVGGVPVLPPEARVDGQGYPELAQSWWRWVFRPRDGMRPTQDPTGAQCHLGQGGNVWFLAGTHGTGPVARRCSVPTGRHVFLPVLVRLEYSAPGRRRDCDALRKAATDGVDAPATLRVELNGQPLVPVRSSSAGCFDAFADAEHNDPPPGLHAPGFTDGFWLLLPPLPPGRHHLLVEARQAAEGALRGRFDQQFTYQLDVGLPGDEPQDEPARPSDESESIAL